MRKSSVLYVPSKASFNELGKEIGSDGMYKGIDYFNSTNYGQISSSQYNRLYKSVSIIDNLLQKSSFAYKDLKNNRTEESDDVLFFLIFSLCLLLIF